MTNRPSASPRTRASGQRLEADHVHLEAARAQGGRDLEADEARPDHDDRRAVAAPRDDGPRVGQAAQHVHVGQVGARHREADRLGPVASKSAS